MHHPWLDGIFFVFSTTGLGWCQVVLIVALLVDWSHLQRETWSRHGLALPMLITYVVAGTLNSVIKRIVPRERPSNYAWSSPQESFYFNSFSSGHTATAVALAVCLWWLTRRTERAKWGQVALVWSALVGFSRIYRGVHWPTDVACGAAVGLLFGTLVSYWWMQKRELDSGKTPIL